MLVDRLTAAANSPRSRWLVDLQPGSNDLLFRVFTMGGPETVAMVLRARQLIDLTLPDKLDTSVLVARLRDASQTGNSTVVPAEFAAVDWPNEIAKGNAQEGRRLFGALGCGKCHAITAGQKGGGGPSLTDARKRFTVAHSVESVLLPSRQVAETFRGTTIVEKSGKVVTGLVVAESGQDLELLLTDATRQMIRTGDVDDRRRSDISPMPQGLVKTPQ